MVSLWWEEVDSYKSESERACTHSEASSTERWFRIHPNMRKRWIASALGKFVYKLRNATKGITRICKVNNGAVAVCNGANGCFATVLHPLSFAQKKKASKFRCFLFWWEEVDSNHRRRCQQIYSLLPLATRESSHAWSWWSESNQQPADYKSAALPLSHTSEVFGTNTLCRTIRIKMVPWGGVERPTQGFSVPCSTN